MHCAIEKLEDVTDLLNAIRSFGPEIREPKPGVFYVKSVAFLHFHVKGEARWADMRCGKDWGEAQDLPFNPTVKQRREFLTIAKKCFDTTVGGKGKK